MRMSTPCRRCTREGQERRLDLHSAARAMDHRMYAVVANLACAGPGWRSCGGSGVWHPDGRRLVEAGTGPEVVVMVLERAVKRAALSMIA